MTVSCFSAVSSPFTASLALKYLEQFGYFLILVAVAGFSALLFVFLPEVGKTEDQTEKKTFRETISDFLGCLKDEKKRFFSLLSLFSGLVIGFYADFLRKIVNGSLQTTNDNIEISIINQKTAQVFIVSGVFEFLGGMTCSLIGGKSNKYFLARIATASLQLGLSFTLLAYYEKSYLFCFIAAGCLGAGDCILNTSLNAILTVDIGRKIAHFAVYIFWQEMGIFASMVFSIFLNEVFYMGLFLIFSVIANFGIICMKQ